MGKKNVPDLPHESKAKVKMCFTNLPLFLSVHWPLVGNEM